MADSVMAAMGASHSAAAAVLKNFFVNNATFIDSRLTDALAALNSTDADNGTYVGTVYASKWLAERASDGFLTATNIAGEPQTRGKWRNFPDATYVPPAFLLTASLFYHSYIMIIPFWYTQSCMDDRRTRNRCPVHHESSG
jgi:hypothetical protein